MVHNVFYLQLLATFELVIRHHFFDGTRTFLELAVHVWHLL